MCAFSTSEGHKLSYMQTDDSGSAVLSVPPGQAVTLRNGCLGMQPELEHCSTEAGVRPDLDIQHAESGSDRVGVLALDLLRGDVHVFLDRTQRRLEVVYGAGTLHGLERDANGAVARN